MQEILGWAGRGRQLRPAAIGEPAKKEPGFMGYKNELES
jgi:hypothetical protein